MPSFRDGTELALPSFGNPVLMSSFASLGRLSSKCSACVTKPAPRLPAVVGEGLVRVGHLVRVVLLLHGVAAELRSIDQLGCQALTHRLLAAITRVRYQPAHCQG